MSFEQKQYWLKGVEYERERIIKLIKEVPYTDIYVKSGGITLEKHLIALIKGSENVGDGIDNRSEGENK